MLSPFIALLFNKSLSAGCFPAEFKDDVVRPLLKKRWLDASQLKIYRPMSNLSFLSKLLERVVQARLQAFTDSNDMMPKTVCISPVSQYRDSRHEDIQRSATCCRQRSNVCSLLA